MKLSDILQEIIGEHICDLGVGKVPELQTLMNNLVHQGGRKRRKKRNKEGREDRKKRKEGKKGRNRMNSDIFCENVGPDEVVSGSGTACLPSHLGLFPVAGLLDGLSAHPARPLTLLGDTCSPRSGRAVVRNGALPRRQFSVCVSKTMFLSLFSVHFVPSCSLGSPLFLF